MTSANHDLVPVLLAALGVMATVAGVLFWRLLTRLEEKVDTWLTEHVACRERQASVLSQCATKDDLARLDDRISRHRHTQNGGIVFYSGRIDP